MITPRPSRARHPGPVTRFQGRLRTRIRTKLTVSHVLVVTLSLFVFSALMAVLYIFILTKSGVDLATQFQTVVVMTILVTFVIGVITVCSIVVAAIASWYVSRRLTRQISELEEATVAIAEGHLENRVAVLSDDELGRLAVRFNLLAERLQELDQQRRSFVASVSHDLRTPIAIIRGHTDAQLRDPDDETPTSIEAFRAIEHEVITLGKLVDDLFTLSRLEEAALPMTLQPVDLGELVEDAVRAMRPYALKVSRVSVNAVVSDGVPEVEGDPTRLTQIVNNLLHNAVRHTPEGGIVVAEVTLGTETGTVVLVVRDTGVGIGPEDLPKIFDRFYQGDSVRSGGAGLGLSIVKQLVEIQGGSVAAASAPGEGTTITVTLREKEF
ncbi:MAG TPA: ATP-binding protein [Thermomicrobiales bacterium]|nr:ATP-binding protein [Thermomicrobiales bacterium]